MGVDDVDYAALYADLVAYENNPTRAYALMPSSLDGPYVVKYVSAECDRYDRAKQRIERGLLERIRASPELCAVCQTLASDDVIAAIVDGVRAHARPRSIFDSASFERRLTVSVNLKRAGFAELHDLLVDPRPCSVWTCVVLHRLIADALRLLHAHGIYQGDMHMRNVLYALDASTGVADIRVIDFDLGVDMSETNRLAPLGGQTIVAQRAMYKIGYSFPNYMYTDATRLYEANAGRITSKDDLAQYGTTARQIAELRGLKPLASARAGAMADLTLAIGGAVADWQACADGTWPSSVCGVATFARYDASSHKTWVLRVVQRTADLDDELFAHEICNALAQRDGSAVRGVPIVTTSIDAVDVLYRRFGMVRRVPFAMAYGCVLLLRIDGRVTLSAGDAAASSIAIDGVRVAADMARVFPPRAAFASAEAHAQFEAVYARPLRDSLELIDARRALDDLCAAETKKRGASDGGGEQSSRPTTVKRAHRKRGRALKKTVGMPNVRNNAI